MRNGKDRGWRHKCLDINNKKISMELKVFIACKWAYDCKTS